MMGKDEHHPGRCSADVSSTCHGRKTPHMRSQSQPLGLTILQVSHTVKDPRHHVRRASIRAPKAAWHACSALYLSAGPGGVGSAAAGGCVPAVCAGGGVKGAVHQMALSTMSCAHAEPAAEDQQPHE